jgi:hypothetical protein
MPNPIPSASAPLTIARPPRSTPAWNAADDVEGYKLDIADGAAEHHQFDQPVERGTGFVPDVDQVDDESYPDDKVCDELHESEAGPRGTRRQA